MTAIDRHRRNFRRPAKPGVRLLNRNEPSLLVTVLGSPASQTPLSFKSKQHLGGLAYTDATVLDAVEAAGLSELTGGVKKLPATTPLTETGAPAA